VRLTFVIRNERISSASASNCRLDKARRSRGLLIDSNNGMRCILLANRWLGRSAARSTRTVSKPMNWRPVHERESMKRAPVHWRLGSTGGCQAFARFRSTYCMMPPLT